MFNLSKKKYYFFIYSLLFVAISIVIFMPFLLKGNGFIRDGDGFNQTYPVLIYIGNYLRDWILHGFCIKEFDFTLGLGEGIIPALSWLGFGDIFTLISVFVKPERTDILFTFIVLLKLYVSGITYSLFCIYHGINYKYILITVFFYVFSRFSLVTGLEFYQNLNPVVWLPLLFLGIDKVFDDKQKGTNLFVVIIFIQALNGFYYLYIETLFCAIYFMVRYTTSNTYSAKRFLSVGLQIIWRYILGIAMAGFMFLPALAGYFDSSRTDRTALTLKELLSYPLESYKGFISYLFVPRGWSDGLGLPVLIFICFCITLGIKILNKRFKLLLMISFIAYFIPATGIVMNGFSYNIDRWSYIVYFWGAVFTAQVLQEKISFNKIRITVCCILIAATILIQYFYSTGNKAALFRSGIYMLLLALIFIYYIIKKKYKEKDEYTKFLLLYVILNVCINGMYINGPVALGGDGYSGGFLRNKAVYPQIENSVVNGIQDEEGFYRVDAFDSSLGASMVLNYKGTVQYFSITNNNIYQFFKEMSISPGIRSVSHILKGIDGRSVLESILSVRYYEDDFIDGNNIIPLLKKNTYVLPFGFTYKNSIDKENFDSLNEFEKMDTLLEKVVISENSQYDETIDLGKSYDNKINYNIDYINIKQKNDKMYVTEKSIIKINYPKIEGEGEVYLKINGLELCSGLTGDIYIGNKSIQVRNKMDAYYIGTDDFFVNLNNPENQEILIKFKKNMEITIDNIELFWYSIEQLQSKVDDLKKECLEDVYFSNNTIEGKINVTDNKFLFLSIPYSEGWEAKVDGKDTEILKANIGFMAIPLIKGEHKVELRYRVPGGSIGTLLTIIGWIIFITLIVIKKNRWKTYE